jgi:predicted GIY-YIG superfamily endonuclease
MYYTYVLKEIGKHHFYVGSTDNLKKRLKDHNNGMNKSTKGRKWELYCYFSFPTAILRYATARQANHNMNKEVTKYIDKQKSPQKDICKKLRRIILKTFSKIDERMYVGVPWYGDYYYFVGLKDHVNLGFSIMGLTKKQMDLFEGKGKKMRHK